jgi:hypothetical protein
MSFGGFVINPPASWYFEMKMTGVSSYEIKIICRTPEQFLSFVAFAREHFIQVWLSFPRQDLLNALMSEALGPTFLKFSHSERQQVLAEMNKLVQFVRDLNTVEELNNIKAVKTEQPTEQPTEPSTEPTEPSTEPTEPSTEQPTEQPTEPSTEPTEPSTEQPAE